MSVLFADLVGFTTRSEDEDPELVREFLATYFDRAGEIIGRYGGVVEKFIGDAVMAVWGTPTTHEDDAERAVRAGLDLAAMVRSLAGETRLRVAVMTGEAAVNPVAGNQAMVAGDLVNSASRLQGVATPGSVLVDETTMVAAGRAVAFDSAGEFTLKGKAEPVRAWIALRVVAERGGAGRREGLEPPFVGRHEELRLLKESLHATAREGRSRLVTIVGQAGLGKSRLAWELKKYTDGLAETIFWHEGESPAYGETVAYWALGGMVRWRCRISDGDAPETARQKLAGTVAQYAADETERDWIEPRLAALLGLADTPAGDREELFAAWRTFFERIAEQGTVTLIFEDLHWADDSLFDFIDELLEWSRDHPILVVGLARPELLARRPGWGTAHRAAVTVHLEPLTDEALGDLLRGLVPGLPQATLQALVARAEGVPLYAVETIRMLLDGGRLVREGERYRLLQPDAEVEVPASLQALVSARLDTLDEGERSLVQDASVLGKSFTRPALAAVDGSDPEELDRLLEGLVRKEVLARDRTTPNGYEFVQSLIREVAYSTLSRRDRQERHTAAAAHYESLDDEELAGLVAGHLFDAYRSAPDDAARQSTARRARVALRAAAERSIALHANQAAVGFIEQALSVTDDAEERARLWVMATEPAQAALGVGAGERYIRQAVDWYQANGYEEETDEAVAIMASWLLHTTGPDEIIELVGDRVARIDDATAGPSAPQLLNELGRARLMAGEPEAAIEPLDRGMRIAEHLMLEPVLAELLATKAWAAGLLGRHRESLWLATGALSVAEEHGMIATQLRARMNLSDLYTILDPRRGFEVASAGVDLAQRVGHATWAAALAGNEGFAANLLGEWQRPIERARQLDHPSITGFGRVSLGGMAAIASGFLGQSPPAGWDDSANVEGVSQGRTALLALRAMYGFASGDLEATDELALASTEGGSSHFVESTVAVCFAVNAMIWLGERERLAALVEHLEQHQWNSAFKATTVVQSRAALAALGGATDEAVAGYREALEGWRRLGLRPSQAVALVEMLRLFGTELPDHAEIAAEARAIMEDLGAVSLLARLDEVAPRAEAASVP